MSTIGGYTTRQFSETQKFLVLDPSTQSTSLVSGSSLIEYIQPRLNSVVAESTRVAAQNTDYKVGSIIRTSGDASVADGLGTTFLVVGEGEGDFPMINGNELLTIPAPTEDTVIPRASVAQMVSSTGLVVGDIVRTSGYYAPGDGGGNDYEIVAGGTGTADGGSFIDLDNGLQARGLFNCGANVKQFGAGGMVDDSFAFQSAASFVVYREYQTSKTTVNKAGVAEIEVPPGEYTVSTQIKSSGQPVWRLSSGALLNTELLNGSVYRAGRTINSIHTGVLENATTFSIRAGLPLNDDSGVFGIASLDALSRVGPPHSVTLQVRNDTQITPLTLTGTTYTATTVTYTNELDLSDVKEGSLITVFGTSFYTGMVQSVDQENKIITVDTGWYKYTGVNGVTGTPVDGDSAVIDYFIKIWGQNTNVELQSGHPTQKAAGYELGVLNHQEDATSLGLPLFGVNLAPDERALWGFDAVNLGPYDASVGFLARASLESQWLAGFLSYGNKNGFQVIPRFGQTTENGFVYDAAEGNALLSRDSEGSNVFRISWKGDIECGGKSSTSVRNFDFNTSGNANDFDVRISSTGGSTAAGEGLFTIKSLLADFSGTIRPTTDNVNPLGGATRRFTTIYATSGTINTSDEREKTELLELNARERAAAKDCKALIRKFRFNAAVAKKGDKARWHFGVGAQSVAEAFKVHGLDAADYALFCYDEWPEQPELKDDEGGIVQEYRPAGNRYGIRYEELLAFIISAL